MAKLNVVAHKPKVEKAAPKTHGGGEGVHLTPEQELRRSLMACLLFEKNFYEAGALVADRITQLVPLVAPERVAQMAVEARLVHKLRHAPLWVVAAMLESEQHRKHVGRILPQVLRRPDEMSELLRMHWGSKKKTKPLGKQLRMGLQAAFLGFDQYQLAKYIYADTSQQISLWDVFNLAHPKPQTPEQAETLRLFAANQLPEAYTWENELKRQDGNRTKRQIWEELLASGKLPAYALLSNLRNMHQAGCDIETVADALEKANTRMILPFRFLAAVDVVPQYKTVVEQAMIRHFDRQRKLSGTTLVIIDLSGSMNQSLSERSKMERVDGAIAQAVIANLLCEKAVIYGTAGSDSTRIHKTEMVPDKVKGLDVARYMKMQAGKLGGGGIFLTPVLQHLQKIHPQVDRILVVTDEQDCTAGEAQSPKMARPWGSRGNYLVNVSTDKVGIAYGQQWTHMDTLSDAVFHYMQEIEKPSQIAQATDYLFEEVE
jgi:60 kDa SS-A/Ro ribonucleoprotein